ncbi:MAG: hypothetical protein ABI981_07840 [Betaproteobacteria bacterium]
MGTKSTDSTGKDNVHGEGNYAATRDYNERTRKFLKTADVDKAAHDAAPRSDAEAKEMQAAEAKGLSRAKTATAAKPGGNPPRAGKR